MLRLTPAGRAAGAPNADGSLLSETPGIMLRLVDRLRQLRRAVSDEPLRGLRERAEIEAAQANAAERRNRDIQQRIAEPSHGVVKGFDGIDATQDDGFRELTNR